MRVAIFTATLLCACAGTPTPQPQLAVLEKRVNVLEARLAELEHDALDKQSRHDDVDVTADPASFTHKVDYELGAAEFYGEDFIEILSVKGDRPGFQVGGNYEIRGRYKLATRDQANLLVSVTAKDPQYARGRMSPRAVVALSRGEGEFVLLKHLSHPGWPHLTMYRVDTGKPIGGVYFGSDEWLLESKTWRYEAPDGEPATGNDRMLERPDN